MGRVVDATPQLLYTRERPGSHCIGEWVSPRPVWTGAKISPPPGFDPRTAVAHIGTLRKPTHNLPVIMLHGRHMLILQAVWVAHGSDKESRLACIKATGLPFSTLHLLITRTYMQRGPNIRNYRTMRVNEHKNVLSLSHITHMAWKCEPTDIWRMVATGGKLYPFDRALLQDLHCACKWLSSFPRRSTAHCSNCLVTVKARKLENPRFYIYHSEAVKIPKKMLVNASISGFYHVTMVNAGI
jgi:hypothetical protein